MNKEEMIAEFTKMIDHAHEAGWHEGYIKGMEFHSDTHL